MIYLDKLAHPSDAYADVAADHRDVEYGNVFQSLCRCQALAISMALETGKWIHGTMWTTLHGKCCVPGEGRAGRT